MHHSPASPRTERGRTLALGILAVVSLLVILAAVVPAPYVIERPGPVVNVLGTTVVEEETVPVIEVEDTTDTEADGAVNLVAVSVVGSPEQPTSWLQLLPAVLDHTQDIVPTEFLFPDGTTGEEREADNAELMVSSQSSAIVAASNALGAEIVSVLGIAEVIAGSPAEGVLQTGDLLLAANGVPLTGLDALSTELAAVGAGGSLVLDIERDGVRESVTIVPEAQPESDLPRIGVSLGEVAEVPDGVTIHLEDIGGPSAGLAFALGLVEILSDEALIGDLDVTATGTITGSGSVGAIGGLAQKLWSAERAGSDLMLIPLENCAHLPDQLPRELAITPVATLDEALAAIADIREGREPDGLERCAVP